MVMISVADLLRRALPAETGVIAGESGLGREVTWATRLRPAPPAFSHLNGGELVLLPPGTLELLDERLTLDEAIRQLSHFGVAAVAVSDNGTAAARSAADEASLPLLQLPDGIEFGTLERETSRFIAERRREIQRRGQEVGRKLMELAIAGEPLSALARDLARLSSRAVALENRDGHLLVFQAPVTPHPTKDEAVALLLTDRGSIYTWLRSVAATSLAEPPTMAFDGDTRWSRIIAPVSGRDGLLGSLSLFVERGTENVEDALLASRGAAACAVTLAREQAAANARREVELNVLDEILDGALRSEVSLLQQTNRLGHDLNQPHCALVARMDAAPGSPARSRDGRWSTLEETLARATNAHAVPLLWRVRNNSAEVIWPAPNGVDILRFAAQLRDDLIHASANGNEVVSIGVGRPRAGIEGIRRSHQEARQALTLGRRIQGPGHLTTFNDLGIYRLIYAAESLPELRTFHDESLGALLAYDQVHGAELIKTLEAYFVANCSPKEAASVLHVHRNTVLYRLDRIKEITGLDLDAADVRLRLNLALHVRLALSA